MGSRESTAAAGTGAFASLVLSRRVGAAKRHKAPRLAADGSEGRTGAVRAANGFLCLRRPSKGFLGKIGPLGALVSSPMSLRPSLSSFGFRAAAAEFVELRLLTSMLAAGDLTRSFSGHSGGGLVPPSPVPATRRTR